MGAFTYIEWCDHTWNTWRGCAKPPANEDGTGVAPECWHCYAEANARRNPGLFGVWGRGGTRPIAAPAYWDLPFQWARKARKDGVRRKVFAFSLADVFEDRDDLVEHRARTFDVIDATADDLDYLVLTKRPESVPRLWPGGPRRNVWLGTSCGATSSLWRIDALRRCEGLAELLFISAEPLVEEIDLAGRLDGISWLICGGESRPRGREPRPFDIAWAFKLRNQAQAAGVAFFMKQLGGNVEAIDSIDAADYFPREVRLSRGDLHYYNARVHLAHPKGGDPAEWPRGLVVREFPDRKEAAVGA